MPTKQEIIDRLESLGKEKGAAYRQEEARIAAEKRSLEELCGGDGQGHFYASDRTGFGYPGGRRACVFCYAAEPLSKLSSAGN